MFATFRAEFEIPAQSGISRENAETRIEFEHEMAIFVTCDHCINKCGKANHLNTFKINTMFYPIYNGVILGKHI